MNLSDIKKYIFVSLIIGFFVWIVLSISEIGSVKRFTKNVSTNLSGGSNRVMTLYDYSGNVIKKWDGKIDLSNETSETDFFIDGKRVIIHGGIAVLEDK